MDKDNYWLRHGETMDEMKEESVEFNEEPFDDMLNIVQNKLMYYVSLDIYYHHTWRACDSAF